MLCLFVFKTIVLGFLAIYSFVLSHPNSVKHGPKINSVLVLEALFSAYTCPVRILVLSYQNMLFFVISYYFLFYYLRRACCLLNNYSLCAAFKLMKSFYINHHN